MHGLSPAVFDVRLSHSNHDDRAVVEVWSRMYDIRLGFRLRAMWGDPRRLADWVEGFIGGTVSSWYHARIGSGEGREMAQALMPHWEREIHRHMERLEYEGRRDDRFQGRRHFSTYFDDNESWIKSEDPQAKQKARQLLIRNLDAGQLKSFEKEGSFRVTAKDGKTYIVSTARSFNVKAEDGTKYCGQLADTPIEDQMLAQKLLLEHDPDKFFKNANISPATNGQSMTATEIMMRQQEAMMHMPRITGGPWGI